MFLLQTQNQYETAIDIFLCQLLYPVTLHPQEYFLRGKLQYNNHRIHLHLKEERTKNNW